MTVLTPTPVSTERFRYDAANRLFTVEASDIGLGHGLEFERVFDDACDVGLSLISAKTGQVIACAIEHEELREGDTLYWDLRPAERKDRDLFTVRIFND